MAGNMESDSWSERKYRGKTSFALPEVLGMSNKEALIAGVILLAAVGVFLYARYKTSGIFSQFSFPPVEEEVQEEGRVL